MSTGDATEPRSALQGDTISYFFTPTSLGKCAARDGLDLQQNPYPTGSDEASEWHDAFMRIYNLIER